MNRFAIAAVVLAIISVPVLGFVIAAELRADDATFTVDRAAFNRAARTQVVFSSRQARDSATASR